MIKIQFKNITGTTPAGFIDSFMVDAEPIFSGVFEIELETENPVSFKGEDRPRVRKIQQIFYPKYKLTIPDSQETRYEMLKYASEVYIVQDGQFNQQGEIIEVSRSFTDKIWTTVIEYYNLSSNDYNRQIAEHLKSDIIKDLAIPKHKLYYSGVGYVETRLNPIQSFPDAELEQTTQHEINITNKSVLSRIYTYIFFCSESDVISIREGMFKFEVIADGVSSKEITNPRVKMLDGWDIYKVEIDFIKDKLIYKI